MTHPNWADPDLSRDLARLRARGEDQGLEFKREFPANARDLAKEIAAFASTNPGMILLGVEDDGELTGLPGCDSGPARDRLLQRVAGVFQLIKPPIAPIAKFALEDGKVVLAISVLRGARPVYFVNYIAYVRQLTSARPAEPEEIYELVIDAHRKSHPTSVAEAPSAAEAERSELYSNVARVLISVLVLAEEFKERQVNPWFDLWRDSFADFASELRNLATTETAVEEGVDFQLKNLARLLDVVAEMRVYLGAGPSLRQATTAAQEMAQHLFDTLIKPIPVGDESRRDACALLRETTRRLDNLVERAQDMVVNRPGFRGGCLV